MQHGFIFEGTDAGTFAYVDLRAIPMLFVSKDGDKCEVEFRIDGEDFSHTLTEEQADNLVSHWKVSRL